MKVGRRYHETIEENLASIKLITPIITKRDTKIIIAIFTLHVRRCEILCFLNSVNCYIQACI